jgi:hypothetical protein
MVRLQMTFEMYCQLDEMIKEASNLNDIKNILAFMLRKAEIDNKYGLDEND